MFSIKGMMADNKQVVCQGIYPSDPFNPFEENAD
jgi:hypothetical protein